MDSKIDEEIEPLKNSPKCDGCGQRYEKGDFPVAVNLLAGQPNGSDGMPPHSNKQLCRKCREPFIVKTKEEIAKIPIDGPNGNGIRGISMLAARAVLDGRGLVNEHPSEMLRALAERVDNGPLWGVDSYLDPTLPYGEIEADFQARIGARSDRLRAVAFDDRFSSAKCDVSRAAENERAKIAARWSCKIVAAGLDEVAALIETTHPKQAETLHKCATQTSGQNNSLGDDAIFYRKAVVTAGLAVESVVCMSTVAAVAARAAGRVVNEPGFAHPNAVALALIYEHEADKAALEGHACIAVHNAMLATHRACLAACAGDVELVSKAVFDDVCAGLSWRIEKDDALTASKKRLRESLLELFEQLLAVGQ